MASRWPCGNLATDALKVYFSRRVITTSFARPPRSRCCRVALGLQSTAIGGRAQAPPFQSVFNIRTSHTPLISHTTPQTIACVVNP